MFIPLFGSILPFLVWPIEIFLPYPHLVEEIAKALLIFLILKSGSNKQKVLGTLFLGFLFAFSENILYMFNIISLGSLNNLFLRFILTTPMHIVTSLVILVPALIDKRLIFLGLGVAAFIHYLFNIYVGFIET